MDEKAEWLNERARANQWINPFGALATMKGAARAFVRDWRTLIGIEVFVVLLAFVVITPMSEAFLRMLISRSGNAAVTDVDIALFFFTTKSGLAALLLIVVASLGITMFGQACLMTVGIARARGAHVRVRDAVAHGATRAISILRLTLLLFGRVLVLLVPFVAASGATYWLLYASMTSIITFTRDRRRSLWPA